MSDNPAVLTQQASAPFERVATDGLCLAISVDDARPERGFGGEQEQGPLGFLLRLYEELGCKATLFVPTDWQGRLPVRQHLDWLGWLREQPCFEVACHGHLHAAEPGGADPGEFRGIDAQTAEARIRQSLDAFAEADCTPLGFKAPGWFLEPSAYAVLDRHFRYVADHVIGTEASRLQGGRLLRLPYLYTIDRIGPWPDAGLVVLQSHVAPEGTITNGWCEWLYERVLAFARTGVRLGARFVTLGEFPQAAWQARTGTDRHGQAQAGTGRHGQAQTCTDSA